MTDVKNRETRLRQVFSAYLGVHTDVSMRHLSRETGLSTGALSRIIGDGGIPAAEQLLKIMQWLLTESKITTETVLSRKPASSEVSQEAEVFDAVNPRGPSRLPIPGKTQTKGSS